MCDEIDSWHGISTEDADWRVGSRDSFGGDNYPAGVSNMDPHFMSEDPPLPKLDPSKRVLDLEIAIMMAQVDQHVINRWALELGLSTSGLPPYSTNLIRAMEFVDHLRRRNYEWTIRTDDRGWYVRCSAPVSFGWQEDGVGNAVCVALPEAICKAGKAALAVTQGRQSCDQ